MELQGGGEYIVLDQEQERVTELRERLRGGETGLVVLEGDIGEED